MFKTLKCMFSKPKVSHMNIHTRDIKKNVFDMWYPCKFIVPIDDKNVSFNSLGKFIAYFKSWYFRDRNVMTEIGKTNRASHIMKLESTIKNYNEYSWSEVYDSVLTAGLYLKFTSSDLLKVKIVEVNVNVLKEKHDKYCDCLVSCRAMIMGNM